MREPARLDSSTTSSPDDLQLITRARRDRGQKAPIGEEAPLDFVPNWRSTRISAGLLAEFDVASTRRYPALISPVLPEHLLHFAATACGARIRSTICVILIERIAERSSVTMA